MSFSIFSHPEFLSFVMTNLAENVDAERYLFCLHFRRVVMLAGAGSSPSARAF